MKKRVLYVDDETFNQLVFDINFKDDYEVFTAASAEDGLEILDNNKHILALISDMKMPGMDGVEFCKLVKDKHPGVIAFILTGFEITPSIRDALNNKIIRNFFRKPLNIDEITLALHEALKNSS